MLCESHKTFSYTFAAFHLLHFCADCLCGQQLPEEKLDALNDAHFFCVSGMQLQEIPWQRKGSVELILVSIQDEKNCRKKNRKIRRHLTMIHSTQLIQKWKSNVPKNS